MAGLTYEDTVRAAGALLAQGRNPSVNAVLEHLGRGSKTTVHKHLSAWRETLEQRSFRLPPEIPEALIEPLEQFWHSATALAHETFSDERQRADEEIALERETAAVAARARTEAEERATALSHALEQSRQEASHQAELAKERATQIERLNGELEALRKQAQQDKRELEANWAARLDAQAQELKGQILALESTLKEREEALARSEKRYEEETAHWMTEVSNAREDRRVLQDRLDRAQEKYEEALKAAEKTRSTLGRARADAEAERDRMAARLEEVEQALAEHDATLQAARDETAHMRAERDRWQTLLEQVLREREQSSNEPTGKEGD